MNMLQVFIWVGTFRMYSTYIQRSCSIESCCVCKIATLDDISYVVLLLHFSLASLRWHTSRTDSLCASQSQTNNLRLEILKCRAPEERQPLKHKQSALIIVHPCVTQKTQLIYHYYYYNKTNLRAMSRVL